MGKVFNVTADCKPQFHYMVDISGRLREIACLVDMGEYFTINRARQYGKTTTLRALKQVLEDRYLVVSLDFRKIGDTKFRNENTFSIAFSRLFLRALCKNECSAGSQMEECVQAFSDAAVKCSGSLELLEMFEYLSDICGASEKPVVLMIDEVDSAANNQVFLDFLAQLRAYYIDRDVTPAFWSVILAGVYDVKNLKRRIRTDEEHKVNSPWNIAADFNVEMSFSASDISGMLAEYEADYHTGMDVREISEILYEYTSGYPFLVSRLCQIVDERIAGSDGFPKKSLAWTREGILGAVKLILAEKNTLFETLANKLAEYPELKEMLYAILFSGDKISFNHDNPVIDLAAMLGFVKSEQGTMMIANRLFETRLYNLFLSEEEVNSRIFAAGEMDKNQFVRNGILDMDLVLRKFMVYWQDLYSREDEKFIEDNGRKFFLLYLKPIINGAGNYYIESRTRDRGRTDVIVDYNGNQYIVEIKIWRGNEYNKRGERQLADYMEAYHAQRGYLLSFNFNKKKETGVKELQIDGKTIVEVVV